MRVKLCECETFLYFVKLRESSKLAPYSYLSNFTIAASPRNLPRAGAQFSKISGDLIDHLNTQISGLVAARYSYSLRIARIASFMANFSLCSLFLLTSA